jgi:7-cyano-7-deazaguanine synthase
MGELHGAPAVVLVSGGMDSAVVLAEARERGFAPYALTFEYGQRHRAELAAAARVARSAVQHRIVSIDLGALGGSSLTADLPVPKGRSREAIGHGVPSTYVPARNTVFLSVALAWAEVLGARDLFCGVNAIDSSGYPDCRPEFLAAFERLARLATAAGTERDVAFRVHAPLMQLTKGGIVRRARELRVDLGATHTCYDPVDDERGAVLACGRCDACILRLDGFAEAGERDPIAYAPFSGDGGSSSGSGSAARPSTQSR